MDKVYYVFIMKRMFHNACFYYWMLSDHNVKSILISNRSLKYRERIIMNKRLILYVHGQGGRAEEASVYEPLFPDCAVKGMVYTATSPWEAREEFPTVFDRMCSSSERITLIANSIGAYFSMEALPQSKLEKAYFISPIVHMEKLIETMMGWANVTEKELQKRKRIETDFGQTLSWEYLNYVRTHPQNWNVPTRILYGETDALTSLDTITDFARTHHAALTVMPHGEHWFHTHEQMEFLFQWLKETEDNF